MQEIIETQTRMLLVYSPLHYSDVQKKNCKADFNQKNLNQN